MSIPRQPNGLLRALLAEADWTQGSLARAVNAVASEVGRQLDYDRTAVAHWLSGTQPHPPVPEFIAEALTRRLGRPVSATAAGFTGVGSGYVASSSSSPTGQRWTRAELVELYRLESDPVHRPPAQALPYQVSQLADLCRSTSAGCHLADVPHEQPAAAELTVMRLAVRFYRASLNAHGGRAARSALATFLADAVIPGLHGAKPAPLQRTLLVEASRLTFLLARMYEDAASHGLAQRHFIAALQLARESGDRSAQAVVLRGLSAQGLSLGHHRLSLMAAEAAVRAAGTQDSPAGAYLLTQLAVAQAACGHRREALVSLLRAERAIAPDESGGPPDSPFDTYSQAALEYQSAKALQLAGDIVGAHAAMSRSLAKRSAEDRRGLALSYAQQAEMLMRAGHVEAACSSWQSFLEQYGHLGSGKAHAAVVRSRQLLKPFSRVPAAATVLEQLAQQKPAVVPC